MRFIERGSAATTWVKFATDATDSEGSNQNNLKTVLRFYLSFYSNLFTQLADNESAN